MFALGDKIVVISGGGSGIGRAIAILFAKMGGTVFILDLNMLSASEVVRDIGEMGGGADYRICDVADRQEVEDTIRQIIKVSGRIDILVNNAGVAHVGSLENTTAEDVDRLMKVNINSVFYLSQAAIPFMKDKGGVILNVSSIAAHVGLPDRFAYSLTKGAVAAMTLSIARDYLSYKIRCNAISPARVHTPFVDGFIRKHFPGTEKETFDQLAISQPIGRMANPEEVAALALYLCSDEASFVTGCDYPIDGGFIKLNN